MDLPSLVGQGDFFGTSAGYPGFTAESINLGTMFAGETVQIRFNASFQETFSEFYTDGWFVDNIRFDGINNTPFTQVLPDGS
ncbi:MAG: hypothetical protein MJA83_14960 [Gammaproteobacteria bacterium]|nr:hypothetical protein [Gammaproteobacteria bacterium]